MITIVDYGMGNLRSVHKALEKVGVKAIITSNPEEVVGASKVVLPGVGAFGECMTNLKKRNLIDAIYEFMESGKPFLGICLGLQLLFTESEEGGVRGLNIVEGGVKRFDLSDNRLKVPHMGWNQIKVKEENKDILNGIPDGSYFYFVHSYYVKPDGESMVVATTDYGLEFASLIHRDNIYGVQFHPEKSQELGLKLLKNFGEL